MIKTFNTTGLCIPEKHYMADTSDKIERIVNELIDNGKYFTINQARQFGKTTTMYLLEKRLHERYVVISISFEAADDLFVSRECFAKGFIRRVSRELVREHISENIVRVWNEELDKELPFEDLSRKISELCNTMDKPIVLMIDEVDSCSDNETFLSFLGLLREKYLERMKGRDESFYSVILAGVYDVKNLKLKLRPDRENRYNSPWNIAADFMIDMSLNEKEISTMLQQYENDYNTGMNVDKMAEELYSYTGGYPYMVSRLCEILHNMRVFNHINLLEAVKVIVKEKNTLYDDISKKLKEYPQLRDRIYAILFTGRSFPYHIEEEITNIGVMFGFLKEEEGQVVIANRLFEIWFYNLFIAEEANNNPLYDAGLQIKNRFVKENSLDMDLILRKFMEYFSEIYGSSTDKFVEENGRRLFLLYLKPIINGVGNYYVEARTRSMGRTDVIVDYKGKHYVIELKIWHGNEYNERGEKQLISYLDDYRLKRGYMLSFNFNKNKKTGIQEIHFADKTLVEVVV